MTSTPQSNQIDAQASGKHVDTPSVLTVTVPHMYISLREAIDNIPKVMKSLDKKYQSYMLTSVSMSGINFTGDPQDRVITSTGIMIGWAEDFGRYLFTRQDRVIDMKPSDPQNVTNGDSKSPSNHNKGV